MVIPELINQVTLFDSFSLFLRIYSQLPRFLKPLIPFVLIKHLLNNNWDIFLKITSKLFRSKDTTSDVLTSSCLNTAFAISVIFFGESVASIMFQRLKTTTEVNLAVILPSDKIWRYKANNVFDGDVVREMNRDLEAFNPEKKTAFYIKPYVNSFFNYLKPKVTECCKNTALDDEKIIAQLTQTFSEIDYDFNSQTFAALKNDIESNQPKITLEQSFVYFIAIISPHRKNMEKSYFHHVFLIEQFMLNQNVHYRIYQSWKKEATLLEDFNKRNYTELGKNTQTHDEIIGFLTEFEKNYSKDKSIHQTLSSNNLFGYTSPTIPFVAFDGKILSGSGVRYFALALNPERCVKNYLDFVNSHPELKQSALKL